MSPSPNEDEIQARIQHYRSAVRSRPSDAQIEPAGPGEESVWDFPRPPEVQRVSQTLSVAFAGRTIARTDSGFRVIETAGAPVYFFPPQDVQREVLRPVPGAWSLCEWKGIAVYFDIVVADRVSEAAAFAYPEPLDDLNRGYDRLKDYVAFYAGQVESAWIGRERAQPQPSGFYAGWVTPSLRGPFKGEPGSEGW